MYLPPGWTPRPEQERIYKEIKAIFDDGTPFVFVDAPTGIGKSAIARALLEDYGAGLIVTATKQLQDQYIGDFPEIRKLVGRSNFRCWACNSTCEGGFYRKTKASGPREYCPDCPYQEHVVEALNSNYYVANYHSAIWTAAQDMVRELVVIDEGHRIETELMSILSLKIGQEWLELTEMEWPEDPEDEEELLEWVQEFSDGLKEVQSLEKAPEIDRMKASIKHLVDTQESLEWVATGRFDSLYDNYLEYKPLRVSRYEANKLLNKGERRLIMSATILNPEELARSLGLKKDEWKYVYSNEAFAPETRKVYFLEDAPPITYSTMEESEDYLAGVVEMILEQHEDEKGLIHTSSTRLAKAIKDKAYDPNNRLLLAHGKGRMNAYRFHGKEEEPTVLVSPSMTEGVDLRDDLARFIIIAKCPFMSLGDKQVRMRTDQDRDWYITHTVRQIIQACGRGTRSKDDSCVTYILDAKVAEVLEEYAEIVPDWFWAAWEEVG